MSKWISVSDKLPDNYQDVDVFCGFRVIDCEFKSGNFYEDILDHDGDYSHQEIVPNVTHWMPVPDSPNAQGGE